MSFLAYIVEDLNAATDFFYDIYREVLDWVWPFWYAAEFFYDLSIVFNWLAWDFHDFGEWVYTVVDDLRDILTWSNIRSLIRSWLPDIEDLVDWWDWWWVWVGQEIDDWWWYTKNTVQGWIDLATQGFDELVTAWDSFWNITWPNLLAITNSLSAAWDNFWTVTFPTLVAFTWLDTWWDSRLIDISDLIDTAFTLREGWWLDWLEIKDQVVEFFVDPWEWLLTKFTDWFLGPEV